jgi:hypothetical protein
MGRLLHKEKEKEKLEGQRDYETGAKTRITVEFANSRRKKITLRQLFDLCHGQPAWPVVVWGHSKAG